VDDCNSAGCGTSAYWSFFLAAPPGVAPALYSPTNGATVGDGTVTIQWYTAGSDTDYQYYYEDQTAGNTTWTGPIDVGDQAYAYLYGLVPGHQYYWYVSGCTTTSCVNSGSWNFTLQAPQGVAPSLDAPTNGSTPPYGSVTLEWYAAGSDTAYQYLYGDASAWAGWIGPINVGNQLSATLSSLVAGHTYYWYVAGCTTATCASSSEWYFTLGYPSPVAPQQDQPANGETGAQNPVTLGWYAASPDTSYEIGYADLTAGGSYVYSGNLGAQTTDILPTLIAGHEYEWVAYGCTNGCAQSSVWTFTMAVPPPVAPQLIQPADGATGLQNPVTLAWSPAGSDSDYQVSYDDLTAGSGYSGYIDVGTKTSYTLPTLPTGHRIAWAAYGCTSSCVASAAYTFTVYAPAPGAPQPTAPANSATNVGLTPTLSWSGAANAVSGVTVYAVELWDAQSLVATGPLLVTTDPTTQLVAPASQGLVLGRSYQWALYACTGQLCSNWSSYALFTTVPAPGAAQQQTPADDATGVGTSPTLSWTAPTTYVYAGQTHYYVYLYDTVTKQNLTPYDAGTNLSKAVSGLAGADLYEWQVVSCNGAEATQDCAYDTWYNFDTGNGSSAPTFPGAASSWYIEYLDTTAVSNLGCTAAGPGNRLVILDFGRQTDTGVYLEFTNTPATDAQVVQLAESFMQGYSSWFKQPCGSPGFTTLVIGTNNSYIAAGTGQDYGSRWADSIVRVLQNYVATTSGLVPLTIQGGNDIETWGDVLETEAWVTGYGANDAAAGPLFNFGSCDGCTPAVPSSPGVAGTCPVDAATGATLCHLDPTIGLGGTQNPGGRQWTEEDIVQFAGANGLDLMIPEIYASSPDFALQWIYVLLLANFGSTSPYGGLSYPGISVQLPAVLTECIATQAAGSIFTPSQAWVHMYDDLFVPDWSSFLSVDRPLYSTDIGKEENPTIPTTCT
jgi:hypothetical protein